MFVDLVNLDDVLKAVQMRGPLIPMEIKKFLNKGDSITIGAALSTLLAKGLIKYTNVKMGGSPFYYVSGQENKLELLNKYLNDKDKRAFEELRQEKVLKDSTLEPLMRVSLRNIPDFAKKVEIMKENEPNLYWRWYLINEDAAIDLIRGDIQKKDLNAIPESDEKTEIEHEIETTKEHEQEPEPEIKEVKEIKKEKPISETKTITPKETFREEQKTIEEEITNYDDDFYQEIKKFFKENHINIKKSDLIRKGSDYEFIIEMKTPFGKTEYFCKAKSKKKCNEGDLSSAYLQGQNKRMPTVFITTGEITKKAKAKSKDEYKGLLIKEL